jgi:prepilin-type N-terminal cleavage/methylation domain-containing protein
MSRRRGFTLLEVLLAAVLMAVLMTGLWGLMRTYERLFSSGQAKAERAQLARTLMEQLSDDLRSAIPDSPTAMPGASTAARRFGLFGTQRVLQVDVLQVTPAQCVAASTARDELGASPAKSPQVPELHTVQYWFEEPLLDGADGSAGVRGLVRRELDWETPPGAVEEGSPRARKAAAESLSESAALSDLVSTPDPMSVAPLRADPEDPSILWAAEVIDLRFRYYDGATWGTQWNSLERKSLPVAIEVTLTVQSGEEARQRAGPRPSDDLLEELAADLGTPGGQAGQSHRLLVCLPSTGLGRPAKEADEGLPSILDESELPLLPEYAPLVPPSRPSFAPPRPPAPAASPPPREPAPVAGGRKSLEEMLRDQWIRTGR